MNDEQAMNKVAKKIKALLAKSSDLATTPAEKEAFAAKAAELMEKHNLTEQDVSTADDPLTHGLSVLKIYVANSWLKEVAGAVARYYGARTLWHNRVGSIYPFTIIGRVSARTTTEMMLPFLAQEIRRVAKDYATERKISISQAERRIGKAFASRVWELIRRADENDAEFKADHNAVAVYMEANFVTRPGRKNNGVIFVSALEAAGKINLNLQATGGKASAVKQLR